MTDPLLTITTYGLPAPQGSKRHVGNGVMVESSRALKPWREAVKAAALDAQHPGWLLLDEPLVVQMVFTFARPKSHYRTGRNAHLLRTSAPTHPAGLPDLSKLVRSTEDALTDAGVWRDDARVVQCAARKAYPDGDALALATPGAVIRVWRIAEIATDRLACTDPTHPGHGGWCTTCHTDEPALDRPVVNVHLPAHDTTA